jgi:hypothetical protein
MGLDMANPVQWHVVSRVDFLNQRFLCLRIWHGDAIGVPVLVHAGTADERINLITGLQGGGERLQDDNACSLSAGIVVGSFVEAFAVAVRSEEMSLAHHDRILRA